jgi:hypothetical protein
MSTEYFFNTVVLYHVVWLLMAKVLTNVDSLPDSVPEVEQVCSL